jgi:hypothetical protein
LDLSPEIEGAIPEAIRCVREIVEKITSPPTPLLKERGAVG